MNRLTPSIEYPAEWHDALGCEFDTWAAFPDLTARWRWTSQRLGEFSASLTDELNRRENTEYCVAVAGSYARLEACEASDLDFMVISATSLGETEGAEVVDAVRALARDRGIALPNPRGPFSLPIVQTYHALMDKAGSTDDSIEWLSQRMLLLMEARPLYNAGVFDNALRHVLTAYCEDVRGEQHKNPIFLLNDTIRYFRTICVNYQHTAWEDAERWCLRNVKLRHSRVVMYAGLLLTILNAHRKADKLEYLCEQARLTPLQRIVNVYTEAADTGYRRILSAYDAFLQRIADRGMRESLQVEYDHRYEAAAYRDMRVSAMMITSELLRFVIARRAQWNESVLEYLLF